MDADRVNVIKGRAPLRASSKIRSALAQRGRGVGSISYVYSPKNNRDFVVSSDLELLHFLHLESSCDVRSYDLDPERVHAFLAGRDYVESKPDAVVTLFSDRLRIVEVKYQKDLDNDIRAAVQVAAQMQAAERIGAEWMAYTDDLAQSEECVLHDWLSIVGVLTSTAPYQSQRLEGQLMKVFDTRDQISLVETNALRLGEWSLVFSAIFRLCQKGQLKEDLRVNRLCPDTCISRAE
jgi:hypothetical protein